jgi:hypothetical protein
VCPPLPASLLAHSRPATLAPFYIGSGMVRWVYPWASIRPRRNRGKKPHKMRLRFHPLRAGGLKSLEMSGVREGLCLRLAGLTVYKMGHGEMRFMRSGLIESVPC